MTDRNGTLGWATVAWVALVALGAAFSQGEFWARMGVEKAERALLIAADRVHGFVPFSVTVYGFLNGTTPGSIELCRSKIEAMPEPAAQHGDDWGSAAEDRAGQSDPAACVPGRLVPAKGGFSYENDLRFDRPGVYHVQLMVIDSEGRRRTSNIVRVSAF